MDVVLERMKKDETLAYASSFTDEILKNKDKLNSKFDLRIFKKGKEMVDMVNNDTIKILGNNLDNIIRSDEQRRESLEDLQYGWLLLFNKVLELNKDIKIKADNYIRFSGNGTVKKATLTSFDDFIKWFVEYK